MIGQFFKPIVSIFQPSGKINIENKLKGNLYLGLYQSGFEVFKKYPIFGVGNKNYRIETCSNEKKPKMENLDVYHNQTRPTPPLFQNPSKSISNPINI